MPAKELSRHSYCTLLNQRTAEDVIPALGTSWPGRAVQLQLSDREPFRYRDLPDNKVHEVVQGDTLFNIAFRVFRGLPDPSQLWWILADFQPQPIVDPTLSLVPGSLIVYPSKRTIREDLFSLDRRDEANVV